MAVDTPQISIDPYRSQVPLVQIPQQDLQGPPPQGAIYSKTGGIATIADGAMKGLLKGLQMKEEKKYKTAEAVMNAQDAGISAAKKNYEDLLTTEGAWTVSSDGVAKTPNLKTQAAYAAWQTAVNAAAAQRQAFAVPEKTAKPKKGEKKDKTAADGAPAAPGFGGALKQFFERNPHVLPELAITAWKAGQNTPYGQVSPEQQQQKMQMDAAQRQESNQKVADAARATYDQYAGRTGLTSQQQQDFENAKAVLTPISANQKYQVLVDDKGQEHNVPMGTEIPPGWKVYEKPSASSIPKVGTEQEFTSQALKGYGFDKDTAPPTLLKYLHDSWAYKAAQTTSGTSEHMETDPKTGELVAVKTGSSTTRGAAAPKPPAGFAPVGEDGQPLKPDVSQTMVVPNPQGLVEPGNIPIWNRPSVQNSDGTHSSELSLSMADEQGREVLVPTIVNGRFLTPDGKMPPGPIPKTQKDWENASPAWKALRDKAWKHYEETGEHLGKFKNSDDADAYSQILHNRGNSRGKMTKPPAAPGAGRGSMAASTLPPGVRDTGIKSLAGVQFDVHSEESTAKSYDTATQAYNNQINKNRSKAADAKSLEALNATAREDYEKAKARIIMSRAAHLKASGVDPWKVVKHGGKDVQFSQGPDGVYGTMDGINWVNINTGMPYSGQQ